ncbi:MAG: 1-deoxy-D-xylulose-5-phosphate reductoisomerase [Clostridia bacterium]|nr:1-deoxy-D-xylulose-5-phosphate reductoisomerase [Clostridia bacterium]
MKLSILGSTGSIGTQTLDVAKEQGYEIKALCANKSVNKIEQQIREFKPEIAVLSDYDAAKELKIKVSDTNTKILCGKEGVEAAATYDGVDVVLNSFVGMAGLIPTVQAINAGKTIALANKETLVAGGDYVMNLAKQKNISILPVDSEHSAIFQCLQGAAPNNALKKVILTASGGPFFQYTREQLKNVKAADALKHPNWDMGQKITIDCATMMNKGFELIEAVHLFDINPLDVDVLVHRESIVHSMIEFVDNSVIAQLGVPDMRIPIQYALTYPERYASPVKQLDLSEIATLSFYKPDTKAFGCLDICKKAIAKGGLVPTAVNAANEVAVALFLQDKIGFLDIEEIALSAYENQIKVDYTTIDEVLETDQSAREAVYSKYL